MCVEQYVACGGCDAPASESVYMVEIRSERILYPLDEDGDQDCNGEPEYEDCCDSQSDGYQCSACGWSGTSLDTEASRDDCDCIECQPDIENFPEERVVALARTSDYRSEFPVPVDGDEPLPPEVARLLSDRTITYLPLPVERAREINDFLYGMDVPVELDLDMSWNDEDELPPFTRQLFALASDLDPGQTSIEGIAA